MTSQHVVLCEGFEDRAFWAGWLRRLGCEDPGLGSGRRRVSVENVRFHSTKPVGRLVINLDGDVQAGEESTSARDAIDGIVRSRSELGAEDVDVLGVIWECPNAAETSGVPRQQTLERLVSAAVASAYPGRGGAVDDWLDAEPAGGRSHKNYGASYFAKWYAADHGYGNFYQAVWRDKAVVAELETRLRATGAWQIVEALVAD